MKGILADADVESPVNVLVAIAQSTAWREVWEYLRLEIFSFEELGLPEDATDQLVWRTCQLRQIVLVTGNRNKQGEDSLEATLQRENNARMLPVFTLPDAQRVLKSKSYAAAAAEKMLVYLLEIERLRGTGRLYIP